MYIIIISRSSPIIPLCVHARPRILKKKKRHFGICSLENKKFNFFLFLSLRLLY